MAAVLVEAGAGGDSAVLVACSGGPDSTVLAHLAMTLRARGRLGAVTLVYVDHGLRPESAGEGRRVEALAAAGGAAARVVAVEVDRARASLEAAARTARYRALDALAADTGAALVLLGHTASDQAETVFMRILRGTGVAGLAGIPARRGRYLRPLLAVSRAEVLAYLAEHGLEAVDDPMNRDLSLTRNRVRHHWLPALRVENPGVEGALLRLAAAAAEQRAVLDFAAGRLRAEAAAGGEGLDAAVLAAAPAAVVKRVLALEVEARAGALSARGLSALLALVRRPRAGTLDIAVGGLRARRRYGRLLLLAGGKRSGPAGAPGHGARGRGPLPGADLAGRRSHAPGAPARPLAQALGFSTSTPGCRGSCAGTRWWSPAVATAPSSGPSTSVRPAVLSSRSP